jgi:hypothetical protein
MPVELFVNDATTTVAAAQTAVAAGTTQTWTVASSVGFLAASNTSTPTTQFRVQDPAQPGEIVLVTNVSGTTWTVVRAVEGVPAAHAAGFTLRPVLSAGGVGNAMARNGAVAWRNVTLPPYNAPTDGVTNASAAFQRAIDDASAAAAAAEQSDPTIVWVPKGTYRVTQVEIKSGVAVLAAAGTVFKLPTADVTYNGRVHPGYVPNSFVSTQFFTLGTPYTQWMSTARQRNVTFAGFGGLVTFDAAQMGLTRQEGFSVHAIGVYNAEDWHVENVDAVNMTFGATVFPARNGAGVASLSGAIENIRLSGYGPDEVQTVTVTGSPTGGTYTLRFGPAQTGYTTAAITHNATAADVQSALEALTSVGASNVAVTGAFPTYTVTFRNWLGGRSMPLLVATAALTGGTTPGVTVTRTTAGLVPGFGPIQWTGGSRASIRKVYAVDWCPVSLEMDASANALTEDILIEDIVLWRQAGFTTQGYEYIVKFLAGRLAGQESNACRRITVNRAYGQNCGAVQFDGNGTMQDVTIQDMVCDGGLLAQQLVLAIGTWADGGNLLFLNPKLVRSGGQGVFINKPINSLEFYSPSVTDCLGAGVEVATGGTVRMSGRVVLTPNGAGGTVKKIGAGTLIYQQELHQSIAYAATITPDPYVGEFITVGTLAGNIAVNAPTVAVHPGARMTFFFAQPASGTTTRTVTFGTGFRKNFVASTGASARSAVSFFYNGTEWIQTNSALALV